ncbi:SDR family oxidoreductase [Paenibacillus athensensis]|uniref:SDR family NAD(P)-dependent oxidoreductase n=1 Tax=Paenibacillus athensensis TaxID=1967502 RepID=UPI0014309396|nr:SDR family oxidoreductase [Paenibacillus athensensis]MCD1258889.1 SDR family oxidoreductase [Paenibacillus athensensis]
MKTILVTGANGDIAAAWISRLERQHHRIIGMDLKPSRYPYLQTFLCDLSDENEIINCLRQGEGGWLEEVDAIVHLAGLYPNLPLESYDSQLWDRVHAVNVKSLYLIVQYMVARPCVKLQNIVITSSTAAKTGSRDPAYASSKAALIGLAKSLSVSLADRHIRVNTILPGIIETAMSHVQSEERKQFHKERTLAKYIGQPEEVANVISFLLDEQSSYIWGAAIDINGGMTL